MPEIERAETLELIREPGHAFSKMVIILAEGLGLMMNVSLTDRAVAEWRAAGCPEDWLFVVTGRKKRPGWEKWRVSILSNTDLEDGVEVLIEQEMMRQYVGLLLGCVPMEQIVFESESNTTIEQKEFIYGLLGRILVKPQACYAAAIVCHDLHARRAEGIFNKGEMFRVKEEDVWTVKYFPDISNPFNSENWFHWLVYPLYKIMEEIATRRDRKKGYL